MASKRLTRAKLQTILTRRLGLRDPVFNIEKIGGRLIGDIISSTFKGQRDHERQKLIWDALDAEFGNNWASQVGMLLAYTPAEWDLGADDDRAGKISKKAG